MTLEITFRGTDNTRWGAGQGSNLSAQQIDVNFYNVKTAVEAMQTEILDIDAGDITSISITGTDLFFHKSNGDTIGPVTIPVLMFRWRGEFAADTSYVELDTFSVTGVGLYTTLVDHTSAFGDFDEAATDGDGNSLYFKLFGFSGASGVNLSDLGDVALASLTDGQFLQYDLASGKWKNVDLSVLTGLDSLSDVTLTSPDDLEVLRYDLGSGQWVNSLLGTMADQDADDVAITGGSITGLSTPTLNSDAATKQYVDDAVGAGFGAIGDGELTANISGMSASPTGTSFDDYLDYVFDATQGDILFRSSTGWTFLPPGTVGQFLATGGAGADILWDNPVGTGTVTSVASGTGLSGGPITSSGTLSLASIATSRIMANISGATQAPSAQTLSAILDAIVTTNRGAFLTRGASSWTFLAPGSSGYFLASQGAGNDLIWSNPVGSGTVTSVATGAGLVGGPITASGTISLDSIADSKILSNISGGSATPVENTLTAIIDHAIGNVRGDILFRNATVWTVLAPGTAGQVLATGGAGANPAWANSTSSSFAGESDVTLTSPADNDIIFYKTADSKWENETLSALMDAVLGTAQGDLLYRNGAVWTVLAPGTSGNILKTGGAAANPSWESVAAALDSIASTQGNILYRSGSAWVALAPEPHTLGSSDYTPPYALVSGGTGGNPSWRLVGATNLKRTCSQATAAALAACTYNNGTSGVGATLTANANGAITVDGVTPLVNQRILVKNQVNQAHNGIYNLTQVGSGGTPFILTRAIDFDGSGSNIEFGDSVTVSTGATQSFTVWIMTYSGAGAIVFGTSNITWTLIASQYIVTSATTTLSGQTDVTIASLADKDVLVYDNGTSKWLNQRAKYVIAAAAISGVLTASQNLLFHRFSKAVTIPANFGAFLGHSSQAGGTAVTTASTAVNVDKAPTATPNTFSNVGTITFATGTVTPTFASSGGAAISFAQGDVLRIQGPASADATFANFYATLVGYET